MPLPAYNRPVRPTSDGARLTGRSATVKIRACLAFRRPPWSTTAISGRLAFRKSSRYIQDNAWKCGSCQRNTIPNNTHASIAECAARCCPPDDGWQCARHRPNQRRPRRTTLERCVDGDVADQRGQRHRAGQDIGADCQFGETQTRSATRQNIQASHGCTRPDGRGRRRVRSMVSSMSRSES